MPPIGLERVPDFTTLRLKGFFASPYQRKVGLPDRSVVKLLRQLSRCGKVLSKHERSSSGL